MGAAYLWISFRVGIEQPHFVANWICASFHYIMKFKAILLVLLGLFKKILPLLYYISLTKMAPYKIRSGSSEVCLCCSALTGARKGHALLFQPLFQLFQAGRAHEAP